MIRGPYKEIRVGPILGFGPVVNDDVDLDLDVCIRLLPRGIPFLSAHFGECIMGLIKYSFLDDLLTMTPDNYFFTKRYTERLARYIDP
jgi:hypothetical protein